MGLIQRITLQLDPAAQTRLATDFRVAGAKGVDALKAEFDRKMADLKYDFSAGLIDEKKFKEQSKRVADTFDNEVRGAMDRLVDSGKQGTAEYARLGAEIKNVGREAGPMAALWTRTKSAVVGMGAAIAAAFTVRAVVDFGKELFTLGQNAEETASKFNTTFGSMAAEGAEFLADFANKAGLSTQAGQDLLATIGAMVQGMGATQEAALPMSQSILKLAGDLQSFHNVPIQETFTALRSGLVGEYEPLRRFGIVLTAATVEMKAMAMTGKTSADQLTALEKSTAALTLATEKMGPALGDLDRTSGSTANTLRAMNAEWIDFKTQLGAAIVEGVKASGIIDSMGESVGGLSEWVERNKDTIVAWVSTITSFIGTGVQHITRLAVGTKNELAAIGSALAAFWRQIRAEWVQIQAGFIQVAQRILGAIAPIISGMRAAAEAIGLDGLAENLRAAEGKVVGTLNNLAMEYKLKAREYKAILSADDPTATRTDSLGGGIAANLATGSQKGGAAVDTAMTAAAAKAAAKWDAFYQSFQNSMDNSVNAAKKSFDTITSDLERYFERQQAAQEKASSERLKLIATESAAETTIRENALREEQARLQRVLQSTTATEAEKRAAFERTTAIQAELAAIGARQTLEAGDREASGREAAEERKRQALVDSGMTAEEVNKEMEKDAGEAATGTTDKWLAAMDVLNSSLSNLGSVVGGVFGKILSGVTGIVSSLGAAVSGFKAFQEVSVGGLTGIIQKVAGLAGAFGGVVGVASQMLPIIKSALGIVGDILKGVGDFLGITDTNPQTNETHRLFNLAKAGDKQALAELEARARNTNLPANQRGLAREAYEAVLEGRAWGSWWGDAPKYPTGGGAPRPPSVPGAPRPPTEGPAIPPTRTPNNPYSFQHGGWMPHTGMAHLHAGELIFPPHLSRAIAEVVNRGPVVTGGSVTTHAEDQRSLQVTVILPAMSPDHIPDAVVQKVTEIQGLELQRQSAYQGNTRIGR